jgi:hypothetical protein
MMRQTTNNKQRNKQLGTHQLGTRNCTIHFITFVINYFDNKTYMFQKISVLALAFLLSDVSARNQFLAKSLGSNVRLRYLIFILFIY